jgi:repressor LexA
VKLNADKIKEHFGRRLKVLRIDAELTQQELAKVIGTTKATISRYESGKHSPGVSEIVMLANYFMVNPYWLAGLNDSKHVESLNYKKIPVIGSIACGTPTLAFENISNYEYVSSSDDVNFALITKGDSMINARIFDGDTVFVKQQSDVDDGEIAVVLIDSEATLKRVYKLNGDLLLRAENPTFKDIRITIKDKKNVQILGKAMYFKSNLR